MKGLSSVLFCIVLALALVGCGQDKGKATTGKKATTLAQSKEPTQKKSTKAQKKAPAQAQKTQAQKKQQDRTGECNKQANLKNMKGEERKTFVSKCLRA